MNMAGEKVLVRILTGSYIMYEGELIEGQEFFKHLYSCLAIPIVIKNIMISFNQFNFQTCEIISPFQEKLKLLILFAMKKVSNNNQLIRIKELNLLYQSL